jgi:hypothetical protein
MSFVKTKKVNPELLNQEVCNPNDLNNLYSKKCGKNIEQLNIEEENREELQNNPNQNEYLYPILDDPNFNIKISLKKEFSDTRYDGEIHNVKDQANKLSVAEYELSPHQAFVKNFLSFQTPFNSLLLFHGLGSGKTCSAIGVCEEMRDYLRQMGINNRILIIASPNVQDNFKLQLFDERKLKEVDGIWTMKGCLGNKLLKEINPTGMKGLKREKVIQLIKNLIHTSYSFQGYLQFSNEIVRKSGQANDTIETKIRNLQNEYSNNLIVIDEVHNIRISDDNDNKSVAKNLMFLASVVTNIRLLLLSATPMFNSYKEIVWLLNLMNMNDRRGIISVSDIFDKNGEFKKDKDNNEIGKDLLIRKSTGYISYVRGENPYTFPFRVYPDRFSPKNTFKNINEYPKCQINGKTIPDSRKIQKLSLYLTVIGEYQKMGYNYIVDRLRNREANVRMTRKGDERKIAAFSSLKSFGYTDLQLPIEALNIVYPYDGLEELVRQIKPFECIDEEEEPTQEIIPIKDKENVEEIDNIMNNGPETNKREQNIHVEQEEKQEQEQEEEQNKESTTFANIKDSLEIMKEKELTVINVKPKEIKPKAVKTPKEIKPKAVKTPKEIKPKAIKGIHIIEGETASIFPDEKNYVNTVTKGGGNEEEEYEEDEDYLYIDPKILIGTQGLKRIMNYDDTKTPAIKGNFEYVKGVPRVFNNDEIGKYSAKIKTICDNIYNKKEDIVSDGIILIYSSYIDAGIIPMALALEEMGFSRYGENASLFKNPPVPIVDVRTMKPPTNKKDFRPARYIMITGDTRISPNNDSDIKSITSDDNIFKKDTNGNLIDISGEKIKVVLISQAGSEGVDFKAIRQIHILEPWYNINRIEQIIGRGVRNFSHKDLPFEKRNVQIFLYGTLLEKDNTEEAADLYIYRISEIKAVKIGKVQRLLKQISVDCVINHDQTNFTAKNFNELEDNKDIYQDLSTRKRLDNFQVGDVDDTATCDFMKCEFKCLPEKELDNSVLNTNTYNEVFMLINSEKIIQKIKSLMEMRYFYKKTELIHLINFPKKYPIEQIYAALTQIITDNTEYIYDKYGRTGYLINIGDYYLFQPSELNYNNISVYDRSVPIDYKHNSIKIDLKPEEGEVVENIDTKMNDTKEGKIILDNMFDNYLLALKSKQVDKGDHNWYKHCGNVIDDIVKNDDIIKADTKKDRVIILEQILVEHIVDSLMMNEKVELLNYIYSNNVPKPNILSDDLKEYFDTINPKIINYILTKFFGRIKLYMLSKFIILKGIKYIVMFNGPSRIHNFNVFLIENNKCVPASPEDIRDLENTVQNKYTIKPNNNRKMNKYVGFIGFETKNKFMVYKVKDTKNARSTGFRCDQSGKDNIIQLLNEIELNTDYKTDTDKLNAVELCIKEELLFRIFEKISNGDKLENGKNIIKGDKINNTELNKTIWFLDTETAIFNEFEKKEKKIK